MDYQKLFSVIDQMNDQYCAIWEDVCNIESPTIDKKAVDTVGSYFIQLAHEHGWLIEVLELEEAGNPICITLHPEAKGAPIVFSGHIDTVHPVGLFGTPAVRREDTRIYGPGVVDCKGGVVASFMAMDALEQCGFQGRPVKLILQSDEETGSKTSGKKTIDFMIEHAKDAIAFLNTEGIQGKTAVTARKGILRFRFNITGRAVHSALCAKGANAVTEAAHKIIALEKMKDPDGLTCNCGVIQGGTVANTVAEHCSFTADIRFADEAQYNEAIRIVEKVAEETTVAGCTCRLEKVSDRPAMPRTEQNLQLFEKMNEIFNQSGLPVLTPRSNVGGSDAAYTTCAGIPTIDSIGVEGEFLHSVREFSYLESLAASAKRLAAIALGI